MVDIQNRIFRFYSDLVCLCFLQSYFVKVVIPDEVD